MQRFENNTKRLQSTADGTGNLPSIPELAEEMIFVAKKLEGYGELVGWIESWLEGWEEGFAKGLRIGKIQALQEFLGKPLSSSESLETLPQEELEALHKELRDEYETRFKRP